MICGPVGASEAGLGYLLGGVTKLGGKAVDKVLGKILPSVDNALAKIAISYGGKIIMEGNEEALQEVLEPVFKKIALNIDADIDWEEAAYSWFLGALNSAGYGGADVIVDLGKAYGLWDTETANKTLPSYDPVSLGEPGTAGLDTSRPALPDHAPVALGEPGRTGADTVRPALPEDTAVPFDQPLLQPDTQTPQNTPDTWTADMDGLWTDTEADPDLLTDSGTDGDLDLWNEIDTDLAADNKMRPRYEDYLRRYLEGDTDLSMLNADTAAAPEKTQQPAPKPKEQLISDLVPKIQMQGMTPVRATIAAQKMFTKAESRYGSKADVVLEMLQPGQDPGKYMAGFQNAYIAGKLGDMAALENSGVAAYLTEEQRTEAYTLGQQAGRGLEKGRNDVRITLEEAAAAGDRPYMIPMNRDAKKEIIRRGITAKTTIFTEDTAQNPLATYAQRIPKMEGFYDVVMHGADTAVWFFGSKIDAYTLAQIIRQRPDYKKGTPIRLLSCNTGNTDNTGDCVAQLLANELDVIVRAPTEELYVSFKGEMTIGENDCGEMKTFYSRGIR